MTKSEAHAAANEINRQARDEGTPLTTSTMAFAMWSADKGWFVALPNREG